MNMCEVCGKPIPRTQKVCEECEKGVPPMDVIEEFPEDEEVEFYEDEE